MKTHPPLCSHWPSTCDRLCSFSSSVLSVKTGGVRGLLRSGTEEKRGTGWSGLDLLFAVWLFLIQEVGAVWPCPKKHYLYFKNKTTAFFILSTWRMSVNHKTSFLGENIGPHLSNVLVSESWVYAHLTQSSAFINVARGRKVRSNPTPGQELLDIYASLKSAPSWAAKQFFRPLSLRTLWPIYILGACVKQHRFSDDNKYQMKS